MSPTILFCFVIGYFALLLGVAWYTVMQQGGEVMGFIPKLLLEWEVQHRGIVGLDARTSGRSMSLATSSSCVSIFYLFHSFNRKAEVVRRCFVCLLDKTMQHDDALTH